MSHINTFTLTPFLLLLQFVISCHTQLGRRKKQEDRATIVTNVLGHDNVIFAGVFDGTVGDYAAEYVHHAITENVLGSRPFRECMSGVAASGYKYVSMPVVSGVEKALAEVSNKNMRGNWGSEVQGE